MFDKIIPQKSNKQGDISDILFYSFIEYQKELGYPDYKNSLINNFQNRIIIYSRYSNILNVIDYFYSKFCLLIQKYNRGEKLKKKIFLFNLKHRFIIWDRKKYSMGLFVHGLQDRIFAIFNTVPYVSYADLYELIFRFYTQNDEQEIFKLIEQLSERLLIVKPDYVILPDDSIPIERTIVYVCKKLKIPTIVIQHGIYQSKIKYFDGMAADYVLVWGQYFKDQYVRFGKNPERIYIIGYPNKHKIRSSKRFGLPTRIKLYYLGQCIESLNPEYLGQKIKTIQKLNDFCRMNNIDFFYRPHPKDDIILLKKHLLNIEFTSLSESLEDSVIKGDIFISFNSTALIEASMNSKICLQLMDYPLETDNYEKLGVCMRSFKNIGDLEIYLTKLIISDNIFNIRPKFNEEYINISYDPKSRFSEIISQIEKIESPIQHTLFN
ncbi:hypothetical protein [Methanoregula sp.]|jgi:hypothetical protein|uniref:hypothetical protein n=1 Tax=Methanoregula sp. TaxID=2052170 RepID=UPI003C245226